MSARPHRRAWSEARCGLLRAAHSAWGTRSRGRQREPRPCLSNRQRGLAAIRPECGDEMCAIDRGVVPRFPDAARSLPGRLSRRRLPSRDLAAPLRASVRFYRFIYVAFGSLRQRLRLLLQQRLQRRFPMSGNRRVVEVGLHFPPWGWQRLHPTLAPRPRRSRR